MLLFQGVFERFWRKDGEKLLNKSLKNPLKNFIIPEKSKL
jgi:hypothetical protein